MKTYWGSEVELHTFLNSAAGKKIVSDQLHAPPPLALYNNSQWARPSTDMSVLENKLTTLPGTGLRFVGRSARVLDITLITLSGDET